MSAASNGERAPTATARASSASGSSWAWTSARRTVRLRRSVAGTGMRGSCAWSLERGSHSEAAAIRSQMGEMWNVFGRKIWRRLLSRSVSKRRSQLWVRPSACGEEGVGRGRVSIGCGASLTLALWYGVRLTLVGGLWRVGCGRWVLQGGAHVEKSARVCLLDPVLLAHEASVRLGSKRGVRMRLTRLRHLEEETVGRLLVLGEALHDRGMELLHRIARRARRARCAQPAGLLRAAREEHATESSWNTRVYFCCFLGSYTQIGNHVDGALRPSRRHYQAAATERLDDAVMDWAHELLWCRHRAAR